jgi:hypothetical protein
LEVKRGAAVIEVQIREREKERVRQRELKEMEAQAMLERIKQMQIKVSEPPICHISECACVPRTKTPLISIAHPLIQFKATYSFIYLWLAIDFLMSVQKEEDEAARVQQGKKLLADILQANAAQAEAKQARRQAEIEEDRKIAVYLAYVIIFIFSFCFLCEKIFQCDGLNHPCHD